MKSGGKKLKALYPGHQRYDYLPKLGISLSHTIYPHISTSALIKMPKTARLSNYSEHLDIINLSLHASYFFTR